jgi:hypothetical protein
MFVCLSVCVACVVCIVCIVEGCSLGWTHCWVRVDLPGTAADGIIPSHAPNSLATPLRLLPPSLALLPFPAPSSSPATPAKPAQCSHMMQPHELQLRIAVAQSVQRVIPPQPVDPAHHSGNVLARHRLSSRFFPRLCPIIAAPSSTNTTEDKARARAADAGKRTSRYDFLIVDFVESERVAPRTL